MIFPYLFLGVSFLLPANGAGPANAEPFCLARDGKPAASIVTSHRPNVAAAFAAAELQEHIEKITGAELPILGDRAAVEGPRILVGTSAATEQLGLPVEPFGPQEYLIRVFPETIVLMGNDAPRPASANVSHVGELGRADGRHGQAGVFNGSDSGVSAHRCGFLDEVGSLEAWVWLPEVTLDHEGTLLRLDGADPWTYHIVRVVPGTRKIQYVAYFNPDSSVLVSEELMPGWHHVLATHTLADGGQLALFVDGQGQGVGPYRKTSCAERPLRIGAYARVESGLFGNPFRGRMDEVRVSSRVRRPEDSGWRAQCEVDEHTQLLLPFDENDGSPRDVAGVIAFRPPPPRWNEEQGTSYAVHDFLERFCDVRWYGPTELGRVLPQTRTLVVAPQNIRRAPALRHRVGGPRRPWAMGNLLWDRPTTEELHLFWARLRLGGEPYAASHAFYTYYDRFWEQNPQRPELFEAAHPEWFAVGTAPEGERPRQMCFSQPGFAAQVVRDARAFFDGERDSGTIGATGDYFSVGPQDGSARCQCEACRARMNATYLDYPQFSHGGASDYVFGFVNKVARALKTSHPDKYVSIFAYSDYAYYPEQIEVEPNVSAELCLHVRNWWAPSVERNDMRFYRQWVARHRGRLFVRAYYCFPQLWTWREDAWRCFPGFYAHTLARQIQMFCRDGIRGVYFDGTGEQLDVYVSARLMDDPALEVDAILDEFFARYYGAAAEPMRRMYLRMEEIFSNPDNYPAAVREVDQHWHQDEDLAWGALGTPERLTELGQIMDAARQAARTEVEKRRVALFDEAVWEYLVEGRRRWVEKQ